MKLILTTLFLAGFAAPVCLAADDDCSKCKSKDKKESTLVAEADGDCKDGCKGKKKEEGTLAKDCDKCKDGDKKKEEGTVA